MIRRRRASATKNIALNGCLREIRCRSARTWSSPYPTVRLVVLALVTSSASAIATQTASTADSTAHDAVTTLRMGSPDTPQTPQRDHASVSLLLDSTHSRKLESVLAVKKTIRDGPYSESNRLFRAWAVATRVALKKSSKARNLQTKESGGGEGFADEDCPCCLVQK